MKNMNISKVESSHLKTFTSTLLLASFLGACPMVMNPTAFAESVVKTGEAMESMSQYQILDQDLLKVKFNEGSAVLSKDSLAALSDFVKTTKGEARIDHYIVASWADQDFPVQGKLSHRAQKLAELRSKNIKKVLDNLGSTHTNTFEMTTQPNWIQRAFSTETAELKGKGSSNTDNERLSKQIGQRLHDKGGPDSALIIARFKGQVSSQQ